MVLLSMDILYLSAQTSHELTRYCENELILQVLEHFALNGKIIEEQDNKRHSCLWIITDYITNNTINCRNKLSVILSFASNGTVQINDRQEFGDVNVLCMLKELSYISEEDFDYFVEAFFRFSQGKGVKFSM
jgi:hypothetical protein